MQENNFWNTNRGKATLKMGLWIIFIIILLIIYAIGDNNRENYESANNDEKVVDYNFETFDEMQKKIRLGNYEYTYEIKSDTIHYKYQGLKCGNQDLGYKESTDGIIKYYVDGNSTYQILLDNKETVTNLYENVDVSFLNMDILFDNLKDYLYTLEKNEKTRVIRYNKDGYQVKVETNLENITKINIVQELIEYNLEFTKIGECAKISLTEK